MGVFTFVCRSSGSQWTAKQCSGDLNASASSTYELQRKLVQSAVAVDSSGGVQSSFSLITPSVFQVIVGGGGGGFISGGGAAAATSGGGPPAIEETPAEKKKEEKEEESDEDLGLSLFDQRAYQILLAIVSCHSYNFDSLGNCFSQAAVESV